MIIRRHFLLFTWLLLSVACTSTGSLTSSSLQPSGTTITIAAVGDVLLHKPLQDFAYRYGFRRLWQQAEPYLQQADIAFANVEGPMTLGISKFGNAVSDPGLTFDDFVYSSYPRFNYHPNLALALKASGFDLVTISNNHSLDRFNVGVDKTIETCRRSGLICVGARQRGSNQGWYQIINRKGIKIAWFGCTAFTNGMQDQQQQILYCYKPQDRQWLLQTITQLRHQVDAIIISPHWGTQYSNQPDANQINFAKQMLNAGATAIIGSHPHVVQPIQRFLTQDGRETVIAYSLGNFVSFQGGPENRSTVILMLQLTKTRQRGMVVSNVRLIPAYMENRSGLNDLHLRIIDPHHG